MNNQQLNIPTGFEKMLLEGLIRAFFTGTTYYDPNGYQRTEPAPLANVSRDILHKLQPILVQEIFKQIDIATLAKEVGDKVDIKAIRKEVATQVKAELVKKIGKS